MKSLAFETTSLLYVTQTDSSSMQELLMQEHKQKLCKTCSCCRRDTWHRESKNFLQPPNYLIIIVNRITYSNNRITKNKSRIPLDLYIELGPYKFSLQASVDHHGYSMNIGHYTASINCCGKIFHCNDNKITECNITDTYNSSTAYILLYKLMVCFFFFLNFPYKLLWTIMDTLWTLVITQPLSIVVGKYFTVTIIKLPNVISRILIIHLLPIYFCTSSWYVFFFFPHNFISPYLHFFLWSQDKAVHISKA